MKQVEETALQIQEMQQQEQSQNHNEESFKIDDKTNQDKEQVVKANVANGVSSEIMANYMKYYHLF